MMGRGVLLVALLFGTVVLTTSTSGFSSISSDRGVNVAVTDDSSAYLGFEQTANGTQNGTTELEVEVTNRFPDGTRLTTVEVTVDGTTADLATNGALEPGASASRTFESVSCDGTITIEASDGGLEVSLERPVQCE